MTDHLSIGETSRTTGVSVDTLRYYERIGLLAGVTRNRGGQRRYGPRQIARLGFIRRAQAMDFSLDEIGKLLALRDADGDVRSDVRALAENKLAAIEARIGALSGLRDELAGLITACRASERDCPIIGRMDNAACGHTAAGEPT
ncbi:MAG: heavy metal-responsive transcriptional regulator [Gammaproteobacteria bacterium]|nr:heavy metal-responsive transcriptional regulator [Gammaproteobacteria bacterium]